MHAITVARIAVAAKDQANDIKNETTDENVKALMDQVIGAADRAIQAVVTGDAAAAVDALERVSDIDLVKVGDVSPELAFIVDALQNALDGYAGAVNVNLELLEKLRAQNPDLAEQVAVKKELEKLSVDDVQQLAVTAAQLGDVAEALALDTVAKELQAVQQAQGGQQGQQQGGQQGGQQQSGGTEGGTGGTGGTAGGTGGTGTEGAGGAGGTGGA